MKDDSKYNLIAQCNSPLGFNQKGISLVEMLIATGVLSIMTLAILSMFDSHLKMQKLLSARFEIMDIHSGLRMALSTPSSCGCNLKGLQFDIAPTELKKGLELKEIKVFNSDCSQSNSLVKSSAPLQGTTSGLVANRIYLQNGLQMDDTHFSFKLGINISGKGLMEFRPIELQNVTVMTKSVGGSRVEILNCSQAGGIQPGKCFKVTCTSLDGKTKTVFGKGTSGDVITAPAPSGEGFWAIKIQDARIGEAINCWSDQGYIKNGGAARILGYDLCTYYSAENTTCSAFGMCTYKQGAANLFQTCSYSDC